VYCLDGKTGGRIWEYTAGGKVDLPPTIYRGTTLFGSADGWVHCVRATDGELAWKFRAAPDNRRIIAYDRLEFQPVFDGMIAAGGRLFLCTEDGELLCFGTPQ